MTNDTQFPPFEEKTLADYWNVLVKRWKIIILVLFFTLLGGVVYLKIRPPLPFPYRTVFEIGGIGSELVEPRSSVITKLNNFYIPVALLKHAQEYSYEEERYSIIVEGGEKEKGEGGEKEKGEGGEANVTIFGSLGGGDEGKSLLPLLQSVADALIADHAEKVEALRRNIIVERFKTEQETERISEEIASLPARVRRLDTKGTILKKQIAETKSAIQTIEKNRFIVIMSEVGRSAQEESLATTLLILDNDLQKNREKLHVFEEQFDIGLQIERDDLKKAKSDLTRQEKVLEQMLDDIQYRFDHLRETRMLITPSKFLRKTPTAPRAIFRFTFLIGLLLGIFAALFVEFVVQARRVARRGSS